ncbi:hypothetical protein [Frankia sp. Cas3]|uniref:hypothetical protein n=1 Tax=Frankia sp. Cas3 TaxID=3073926 RepID=UPI002AD30617|nr:hypothetical protein [Frankia sp. Cas3]
MIHTPIAGRSKRTGWLLHSQDCPELARVVMFATALWLPSRLGKQRLVPVADPSRPKPVRSR